jgi:hypothetical protein
MYMSCKEGVPSHVLPESMNQNKSLTWITPKVLRSSAATPKLESERERSWVKVRKSSPLPLTVLLEATMEGAATARIELLALTSATATFDLYHC